MNEGERARGWVRTTAGSARTRTTNEDQRGSASTKTNEGERAHRWVRTREAQTNDSGDSQTRAGAARTRAGAARTRADAEGGSVAAS